jgi:hypothetical protein
MNLGLRRFFAGKTKLANGRYLSSMDDHGESDRQRGEPGSLQLLSSANTTRVSA